MSSHFPRRRPALELLEDRAVPALLSVTTAVDSTIPGGEPGSLRAALVSAADGDVITFAPALVGQTIQLAASDLPITHNVTIRGPGANRLTIQGRQQFGSNGARVFEVPIGITASIKGLTIRGGQAGTDGGGGGIRNWGTLTLTDCAVTNNVVLTATSAFGGGIANTGTLTLIRTVVSGNSASAVPIRGTFGSRLAGGGGIANGGTLKLVESQVLGNFAWAETVGSRVDAEGGGVYSTGEFTALRSAVEGNEAHAATGSIAIAQAEGGGVYLLGSASTTTLHAVSIRGNRAVARSDVTTSASGGGLFQTSGDLTVHGGTVADNRAEAVTHAAFVAPGATIPGFQFTNAFGGGVTIEGGTAVFFRVAFTGNVAGTGETLSTSAAAGGGVAVTGGAVCLVRCSITDNTTDATLSGPGAQVQTASGGGLFVATNALVRVRATIIAHNRAFAVTVTGLDVAGPISGGDHHCDADWLDAA